MTDPSNPTYQIARSNPEPQVLPDHPFEPPELGVLLPCWHADLVLEDGHVVRCGLRLSHHPPRAPHAGINHLWDRSDGP